MNSVKRSSTGSRRGTARWLGALAGALVAAGAQAQTGATAQVFPLQAAEPAAPAAMVDETPSLWFVELSGAPTADGGSDAAVQAEHRSFRDEAQRSGLRLRERQEFSSLFNGFSVAVSPRDLGKLRALAGVLAIHPVIQVPRPEGEPSSPALFTALQMTGADVAQTALGLTGRGVKVGVIDSGVDYDNADLGGDGVPRSNSAMFPNRRVVRGWDFVGDAYNADPDSAGYNLTTAPDGFPDDCGGHGTHVAGIVGANGLVTGVAPQVQLAAYRVFGCEGSTNDDIILAALERAFRDRVDVVNMSLGSPFGWPQSPNAMAASRLARRGVVVVASGGNNGSLGLYAAGGPGAGADVISVASVDNVGDYLDYLLASPDGAAVPWLPATGAPPPTAGVTLPLTRTGTPASTTDGCAALPAGSLAGQAVLIRRGGCTFYVKASNAQGAGAAAVLLYNNTAGYLGATVAGTPAITIPVVGLSAAAGAALDAQVAAGGAQITWTGLQGSFASATGRLISSFSSYGPTPDLAFKPDLSAPGGSIYSTFPLEQGGHATLSGTSMAAPHVAGAVALLLQARPHTRPAEVRDLLQNAATPLPWSGNPAAGVLDMVSRQGAGLLRIDAAVTAPVTISPGKLALGESQAGPQRRKLRLQAERRTAVTYDLSYVNALTVKGTFAQTYFLSDATVAFEKASVTVSGRDDDAEVKVTITPPTGPDKALYGGWIVLTPRGGGDVKRVAFGGFVGDYQSIQVLAPTANGFPWLMGTFEGKDYGPVTGPADWYYTMVGEDIPSFYVHLDHQSRLLQLEVFEAATGKRVGEAFSIDYMPRNSSATGFFSLPWDGTVARGRKTLAVPTGLYVARLSVLKALGHPFNEADWERWSSPVIDVQR